VDFFTIRDVQLRVTNYEWNTDDVDITDFSQIFIRVNLFNLCVLCPIHS